MPLLKDISIQSKKTPSGPQSLTVSITATATGSAGYFTGSNSIIYSGATTYIPIYLTLSSSIDGGTPPYTCVWTASTGWYPPGYTAGTNTRSLQLETYAYESDRWIATVTDSSTPPNSKTASYDSVIYANDFEIFVGNWYGNIGSDTQGFDPLTVPGDSSRPLATIGAAIKYAVPDETIMYVASGTYAENPVINKKIRVLDGTADVNGSPRLGTSNYFIYATKQLGNGYLGLATTHSVNAILGFQSGSFSTIAVTTEGSIQSAIYDAGVVGGEVYAMSGVHQLTAPLSCSVNTSHSYTLRGETLLTGSSDTYLYSPATILRTTNTPGNPIITHVSNVTGLGKMCYYKNLALETDTGSFFSIMNASSRDAGLEMVIFRFISNSRAFEMFENAYNTLTSMWMDNHPTSSGMTPSAVNVTKHYIFDNKEIGYGSGEVKFLKYAPIETEPPYPSFWTSAGTSNNTNFSGSRVAGSSGALNHKFGNASGWNARALPTSRPFWGVNDSLFNGLPYMRFPGLNADQYLDTTLYNPSGIVSSSAAYMNTVFRTNETVISGSLRRVITKWGNPAFGWTLAISASNAIISLYHNQFPTSQSAVMQVPVQTGSQYMAEFFFDPTSFNKHVGMALYNTGSLVTSSYFTGAQFSSSGVLYVASGGLPNAYPSVGVGSGNYRVSDYVRIGTGRADFFNGYWAETYFSYTTGSNSNTFQNEVYNYLRRKYFPTSSIVTRSISSDTP
jgi:hypothetical protein